MTRRAAMLGGAACAMLPRALAWALSRDTLHIEGPTVVNTLEVEGSTRVVYELECTSFADEVLRLSALHVTTASGVGVASFDARALATRTMRLPWRDDATDGLALRPGERSAVFVEIAVPPGVRRLRHVVQAIPESGTPVRIPGPELAVAPSDAHFAAPLRAGPWIAIYSHEWDRGHRRVYSAPEGRAVIAGRFAIDFVGVDANGVLRTAGARSVKDFRGFGAPVAAIASGAVVHARGDLPDHATDVPRPALHASDLAGNTVVIEIGRGRFVHYQKLARGTLRVTVGERVRVGQIIGALGNSGESMEPHLHVHVADSANPLAGDGLPLAFERFELLGRYDSAERIGQGAWTPRPASLGSRRVRERPAEMAVVVF